VRGEDEDRIFSDYFKVWIGVTEVQMVEDFNSLEKIEEIIESRRGDIADKSVKDYIQLLFLKNTLLAERTATALRELLVKSDGETAEKFRGIIGDIELLRKSLAALEILATDIGLIKVDQKEISQDIKGLRKDLGYDNAKGK
jgi:hypothetical protein